MSVCAFYGGKLLLALSATSFSLNWVHSVERFGWVETWQVQGSELVEQEVRVQGSGAGIDPAEHAQLIDGWYVWKTEPELRVSELNLAVSGLTPSGWKLCALDDPKPECFTIDLEQAQSEIESELSIQDLKNSHKLSLKQLAVKKDTQENEQQDNLRIIAGECHNVSKQTP